VIGAGDLDPEPPTLKEQHGNRWDPPAPPPAPAPGPAYAKLPVDGEPISFPIKERFREIPRESNDRELAHESGRNKSASERKGRTARGSCQPQRRARKPGWRLGSRATPPALLARPEPYRRRGPNPSHPWRGESRFSALGRAVRRPARSPIRDSPKPRPAARPPAFRRPGSQRSTRSISRL